jgi:hypothetical protein
LCCLCAICCVMIASTSSWRVMRFSLRTVPYSRLLWGRPSGVAVTENKVQVIHLICQNFMQRAGEEPWLYNFVIQDGILLFSRGLRGRVVKTSVSYHEVSHQQSALVRILLVPSWVIEKGCQFTCGRSLVSPQIYCIMYLGSFFHQ